MPRVRKKISVCGKEFSSLSDAAKHFGKDPQAVCQRFRRGWTVEQALEIETRPPPKNPANAIRIKVKADNRTLVFDSIKEAALAFGQSPATVRARLKNYGYTIQQALGLEDPPKRVAPNRKAIEFTINDKQYSYASVTEAAHANGLSEFLVFGRLNRDGWKIEEALELLEPPAHVKKCYGYIYLATNTITQKSYVGQTMRPVDVRWEAHKLNALNRTDLKEHSLGWAIKKFGSDAFNIKKIADARTRAELNKLERYWIKRLGTRAPGGYNLNRGGSGSTRGQSILVEGVNYPSISEAARDFDLKDRLVLDRLRYGWTIEEAFGLAPAPNLSPYYTHPLVVDKDGESLSFNWISELAAHFNLPTSRVAQRLNRLGWSTAEAVGIAEHEHTPNARFGFDIEVGGELMHFASQKEAAKYFGLARWSVYQKRINRGWSNLQALGIDTPPQNPSEPIAMSVIIGGEEFVYSSVSEAARNHGLSFKKVCARLKLGWSHEEALGIVPRKPPLQSGS